MKNTIWTPSLTPDRNRRCLQSHLSLQLAIGHVPDSLVKAGDTWKNGRQAKVLLIVPYYTKISRPLDVMLENIEKTNRDTSYIAQDREIAGQLKKAGITSLDEMKRAGVPMGLLRIGTAAKKSGYKIKVIDAVYEGWNTEYPYFLSSEGSSMVLYGLPPHELEHKIWSYDPDIIAITCSYTHQWGNAREVADLVKQIKPSAPVIMGGTHINGLPEDALLSAPVDYIVLGQADRTFPELLDALTERNGRKVSEVKGIAYRTAGRIHYTSKRPFLADISEIAIPDLSLINLDIYSGRYHSAGERQLDHGYLVYGFTSFGCNTRCNFCTIPLVQGGWVSMTEQVLDSYLSYLKSRGVTEFMLEDDHLLHDPMWAMTVFEKLQKFGMPWLEEGGVSLYNLIALLPEVPEKFIRASVDNERVFRKTLAARAKGLTAEQFIEAMAKSNCYSIYLAVETANQESLGASNKPKLNALEIYSQKIVRLLAKHGIKTTCGLMLGFFNPEENYLESRSQIEKSIAYGRVLMKAGANFINPFIYTPLPGAPNFEKLSAYTTDNTDEGFSHEFGSIDAPDSSWCRDTMSLARVGAMIKTIGVNGYEITRKTGTWPIGTAQKRIPVPKPNFDNHKLIYCSRPSATG